MLFVLCFFFGGGLIKGECLVVDFFWAGGKCFFCVFKGMLFWLCSVYFPGFNVSFGDFLMCFSSCYV